MNTKEIVSFELREQHRKKKSEYNVSRRILGAKACSGPEIGVLKKH